MILTTHAIAGAAIGRLTSNPLLAFAFGVISHFVLDAIPHWSYKLRSKISGRNIMDEDMVLDKRFSRDIAFIGLDFFFGMFFSIFVFQGWAGFRELSLPVLFGSLGGVMPDAFQFLFWKIKREPFISTQRFHNWAHAKSDLNQKTGLGVATQIILVAFIVFLSKFVD